METAGSEAARPLVELAELVEQAASTDSEDYGSAIRQADALNQRSREHLHALVLSAREHGASWQVVGDALGVSRQAAFKRFSTTTEGEAMPASTIDLLDRTAEVFQSLDNGNYEAVRERMTYSCARVLSKRKLMGVWDQVAKDSGRLEECVDLTVQTPDGRNGLDKFANRHLINGAVVQTTLRHEADEWMGRVAYNNSGKITGILIARPGSTNLPF